MPDCVFCEIAAGRLPAALVLEAPASLAFLDRSPLFPGHCLLIPREHHETLMDLPPAQVGPLFEEAQRLAQALEKAMAADGVFVGINNRVSQSVPHLHVHLVPRRRGDGLTGFFWPRTRYPDEAALEATAERIRAALASPS
jgi:histidine triad (HIT) family protein